MNGWDLQPELWNRLGTKLLPKIRTLKDLRVAVDFSVSVDTAGAEELRDELRQIIADLGLKEKVEVS